jgi:hypothetical protein
VLTQGSFLVFAFSFILIHMPGPATAEVIFIASMMILILVICSAAVYFFFRTYAKEKRFSQAETNKSEIEDPKSEII